MMNSKPHSNNSHVHSSNKESPSAFCLSKAQRLKTPADFQHVYSSKQWGGSKHFSFNVLANDIDQKNTLGVTVSKKVSKRAVDRNHLKRIMREFFRHRQSDLKGSNLVLTAKPSSKRASPEERLQSLEELWTKVLKWQSWHHRQQLKRVEQEKLDQTQAIKPNSLEPSRNG